MFLKSLFCRYQGDQKIGKKIFEWSFSDTVRTQIPPKIGLKIDVRCVYY